MTTMDDLGEEFTIKFVNDFYDVERSVRDRHRGEGPFVIWHSCTFLSSAVKGGWPAKTDSAYVILNMIRPMNSSCSA